MRRGVAAIVLLTLFGSIALAATGAADAIDVRTEPPPFLPQILPVILINIAGIGLDLYALSRLQSTDQGTSTHRVAAQTAQLGFMISLASVLGYLSWFRLRK